MKILQLLGIALIVANIPTAAEAELTIGGYTGSQFRSRCNWRCHTCAGNDRCKPQRGNSLSSACGSGRSVVCQ